MMDVLRDIAVIVGLIISIITLITLISGAGKKIFQKLVKTGIKDIQEEVIKAGKSLDEISDIVDDISNRLTPLEDGMRQRCRDQIKSIYYKYYDKKELPIYERKTIDYNYQIYTEKFGGNSYITKLYREMDQWPVNPHGVEYDEE